jgi:peptidoglycan-N-acetylglucosamine deacetylase
MPERTAFLTIDDCPSPYLGDKIDYLLASSIPAVLFCTGRQLEERPKLAKYAIEKGFIIGNHSYSHKDFRILRPDAYRKEIGSTDEIIDRLYSEVKRQRPAKYFRFPYGQVGTETDYLLIQSVLKDLRYTPPRLAGVTYAEYKGYYKLGLVSWTWTCDTLDWKLQDNPEIDPKIFLTEVVAAIDSHFKDDRHATSAEIILMHDHEASHELFPTIMKSVVSKSLTFEPSR